MGEEVNMKQQDIYRYRAAQYLPATLGGPISGQVRLLSDSFGTDPPAHLIVGLEQGATPWS